MRVNAFPCRSVSSSKRFKSVNNALILINSVNAKAFSLEFREPILTSTLLLMSLYLFLSTYLKMNIDRHLKFIMTRFRLGISGIFVHYYRYKRHTDNDLICPLCRVAQETELNFVLCCPVLSALRVQFIPSKFYKFPSLFRLSLLLASTNENIVRNLSVYLYKDFKLRSVLSS